MGPKDLEKFDACIRDVEFFINGFQKKAEGPNGDRFQEPLSRLMTVRTHLQNLHHMSTRMASPKTINPTQLVLLIEQTQSLTETCFEALRSDLRGLTKFKNSFKKLDSLKNQIMSLTQATSDATQKIHRFLKEQKSGGGSGGAAVSGELAAPVKETHQMVEGVDKKVNALARGLTKIGQDLHTLPVEMKSVSQTVESHMSALEGQVRDFLSAADPKALADQLEPRLRNSEDGLKVVLNHQKKLLDIQKKAIDQNRRIYKKLSKLSESEVKLTDSRSGDSSVGGGSSADVSTASGFDLGRSVDLSKVETKLENTEGQLNELIENQEKFLEMFEARMAKAEGSIQDRAGKAEQSQPSDFDWTQIKINQERVLASFEALNFRLNMQDEMISQVLDQKTSLETLTKNTERLGNLSEITDRIEALENKFTEQQGTIEIIANRLEAIDSLSTIVIPLTTSLQNATALSEELQALKEMVKKSDE